MTKTFVGNEEAYLQLQNYLKLKNPGPLILVGKKGVGKGRAAEALSCELLGCGMDGLNKNPDFFLLDKGGESIKVEDVLAILDKSAVAALGTRKVFLIRDACRMNHQAQNKLLKLLEDRNQTNTVILLCEENSLLATIKSRCITIAFRCMSEKEMCAYLAEKGVAEEDLGLFLFLCGCCPYKEEEVKKYFADLKDLYNSLASMRKSSDLLSVLHLVQEKDPKEFFVLHNEHFDEALATLLYFFFQMLAGKTGAWQPGIRGCTNLYSPLETYNICRAIQTHRMRFQTGGYTKNDFFDLIRIMV